MSKIGLIPKRKLDETTLYNASPYYTDVVEKKIENTAPSISGLIDSAIVKGTWTSSGTWTTPAITVNGDITARSSGVKIGTATTELLGFYNANPVNQPDTVADPSGGTTTDTQCRTAVIAVIDRLQELGLIA